MCLFVSQILLCLLVVQLANANNSFMEFKSVRRKELPAATDLTLKALIDCELDLVLVRTHSHMSMYDMGSSNGTLLWRKVLPGSVGQENKEQYPIGLVKNNKFGNILLAKAESGLRFYKLEDSPTYFPKPLFEDTKFADLFGWAYPSPILRWGRIFPSASHLGLLTRNNNGTIKFFAASLQSILDRDRFAVQELAPAEPLQIENWWSHPTTDLQLLDLDESGKQLVIVARGMNNFTIYKFDRKYQLEIILSHDMFSKSRTGNGRILFGNITGSYYQDILLFHSSGLYLSKYDDNARKYTAVGSYITFSKANGWTETIISSVNLFEFDVTTQNSIIYHGPGGLEMARFFPENNETWVLEQIKGDHMTQDEKHSFPLAACRYDKPWVLLEGDDFKLKTVEIGVEKLRRRTISQVAANGTRSWTPLFPEEIDSPVEQVWLNWFDIWDDPLLKNSEKLMELQTGQVAFTLPLFLSHGINLRSSYHSSRHQSGQMGIGWTLPLTNNFILMDPQSSTFEELHSYYISLDGALLALDRTYELDSSTVKTFNVPNQNVTASYYSSNNTWVVGWDNSILEFGGSVGSIQYSLMWPWGYSGKADSLNQLQTQPVKWYLTRRQIEAQTIQYKYGNKVSQVTPAKQYTSEIYLTEILDISDSVRVNFEYSSKQDPTFTSNSPNNPDGSCSFPVPLNQGLLLSAVIATTSTSKQHFKFNYALSTSGTERLIEVMQFLPSLDFTPMIQFEYNDVALLSKINIPYTGVGVSLEYQKDNLKKQEPATYPVGEMGNILFGSGYQMMHQLNRIPYDNVKLMVYSEEHFARKPAFQMQTNRTTAPIKSYLVVPFPSHLFVILELIDGSKRVDLFNRNTSSWDWLPVATDSLPLASENQIFSTSSNFFKISPSSSIVTVLSADNGRIQTELLRLPKRLGTRVVAATQPNFIAIYDGYHIFLIYKREKHWNIAYEKAPSFFEESRNFLDNFDILPELKEGYLKQLDSVTFKVKDNTLVLSSPTIRNDKTFLHIKMMQINSNYKISNRWIHWVPGEIITDQSHVLKNKEGSNFTIEYKKENSKYRLRVTTIAGKIRESVDAIRNRNKKADALEKLLKDLNDHEQWSNLMRNMTILKWQKLRSQFCPQGLSAGEEFLIRTYDGVFGNFPSSNKLRLTAHLSLWQKERTGTEMEITKGDENVKSINVEPAWNIVFALPFFFAYQSGKNVRVIPLNLDGKGIGEEITYEDELVHPQTSARTGLVTTRLASSTRHLSSNEITIRSPTLFQRSQTFLVSKLTRLSKDLQRVTGYEYDKDEKKTRVISGGDRLISGWMDITFDDGRAQTILYNTKGIRVKTERVNKVEAKPNHTAEEITEEYFSNDKRSAKVFSSYPYKLDSDMVSFIGFEENEKDSKTWTYDKAQVVRTRQSFTGHTYANLDSPMEGRFTPQNQDGQYIAGTWVRLPSRDDIKVGSDAPFLKVVYLYPNSSDEIIGLFGKVMLSRGDWLYAEVNVDLPYAKAEVYAPVLNVSLMNFTVPITFKIIISPGDLDDRIHVDNVAFYPSGFNFEATIYNQQAHVSLPTDIIGSSGNVRRYIYSKSGQKIAESDNDVVREMRIKQQGLSQSHPFTSSVTFETRQGFHERWEKSSFRTKWEIESGQTTLKRLNSGLTGVGKLSLRNLSYLPVFALRLDYKLGIDSSLTVRFGEPITIKFRNSGCSLNFQQIEMELDSVEGELVVYFANGRTVVWINGKIMIDTRVSNYTYAGSVSLQMTKNIQINNLVFLEDPTVKVDYHNDLSEPIQELNVESASSVIVSHSLYDNLGRPFLKTRTTRITQNDEQPLLKYYPSFVESYDSDTRTLSGDVTKLNSEDNGFPYYYEQYEDHPQGSVLNKGLPGKNYSMGGSFSSQTENNRTVPFLLNLFPPDDGFHYKSTFFPNGKQIFSVYKDSLTRATYIKAPMYDHRLTTYEYNENGKLVAVFPSEYHKAVDTFSQLDPYKYSSGGRLENIYGTFYTYDEQGRLKHKRNREEGTIHFLYDQFGHVRFRVYQPFGKETFAKTIFTYYSPSGILQRSGLYTKELGSLEELQAYTEDTILPLRYTQAFQDFAYYSSQVADRDKVKQIFTQGELGPVIEEVVTDASGEVSRKSLLIAPTLLNSTVNFTISEEWINQRTKKICHPRKSACFLKTYNQLGNLVSINSEENQVDLRFEYNAMGQVVKEDCNGLVRQVQYNSPGYVTSIDDNFISLSLSYEEDGYTVLSPGAGMASRLKLTPKWASSWKTRAARLNELKPPKEFDKSLWKLCLEGLRRIGCLDKHNVPTGKIFNPSADFNIPLQCGGKTGYRLSKLLSTRSPPVDHGYKVDYGSHGDIVRGKYWRPNQDQTHEPLQPHTFAVRMNALSKTDSINIWKNLVSAEIIAVNQPTKNLSTHIGHLSNIPVLREEELAVELRRLHIEASQFSTVLVKLLARYNRLQKSIPEQEFEKRILEWSGFVDGTAPVFLINKRKALSRQIHKMIQDKHFNVDVLSSQFLQALGPYHEKAMEIAMVLIEHQEQTLGSHPFDEDVLDVDLNGNRKTFIRDHTVYEVQYRNDSTQQIYKLTKTFGGSSVDYRMNYDDDGNVVEAGHKAIKKIVYHPVIKRPTSIEMQEGTKIVFAYDGQGERVVKQVYTPSGYLTKEILYIRDERARVVMEKMIVREEETDSVVAVRITHFVYGPRGLVGFLRDGIFYNVMTDHLGSVRMVTKGQEVVAAYDYMLYGELQSSYVSDPKGDLSYRFCGKELDEETELYNFHARLYDPSLGRFFQTDPLWQYASPYIYAGNSPLSLTDPDGEEVITLIVLGIIGAGVGGYLGGAAINNRWNPADWDFNDPGTYFGIAGGAVAGALLPVGFGASVGAIGGFAATAGIVTAGSTAATVIGVTGTVTLGVGGAYLLTAASNNKWNPAEWEWDKPHTYSSMFQGFAIGSSIPGGVAQVGKLVTKIADGSIIVSRVLTTANFVAGGGVAYAMGVTAHGGKYNPLDWDWNSPGTYSVLFTGFYSGYSLPTLIAGSAKGISKLFTSGRSLKWNGAMLKSALKNPKSPIYKTLGAVAGAYLVGSMANEDFDITSWNFRSFTTYQGILNGAFMGRGLVELIGRLKKPTLKVDIDYTKLRSYSLEHPAAFQKLVEDAMQVLKYLKTKFKVKFNVYNKPKLLGDTTRTPTSSVSSSGPSLVSLESLLEQQLTSPGSKMITADRRVIGIPCAGGRRRRGLHPSCALSPDSRSNALQRNINKSPGRSLAGNAITTLLLDMEPFPINNDLIHFHLHSLRVNQKAFAMMSTTGIVNANVHNTAYFLNTGETITIPASPFGSTGDHRMPFSPLVVTPELGGCSLYVRHNPETNTLSMFHHFRHFSDENSGGRAVKYDETTGKYIVKNPATGVDELYNDVLSFEEYHRDSSNSVERPWAASTAFIYYENGRWHFGNQMLSYSYNTGAKVKKLELTQIKLEGYSSRLIYGVPGADNIVIKPPGSIDRTRGPGAG